MKMNNIDKMSIWLKNTQRQFIIKILKQTKRDIIKYLNKSSFNECYAKSIVELILDKKIEKVGE